MIIGKRQVFPWERVSQVGTAASRNPVVSAAKGHAESRDVGSDEQLQRYPAGDFTTVGQLCHVIIDCLGIAQVAIAAETVQQPDRILSRQRVVVTGAKDRVVRID